MQGRDDWDSRLQFNRRVLKGGGFKGCLGFRVQGLGFGVWGLGFGV